MIIIIELTMTFGINYTLVNSFIIRLVFAQYDRKCFKFLPLLNALRYVLTLVFLTMFWHQKCIYRKFNFYSVNSFLAMNFISKTHTDIQTERYSLLMFKS